MTLIDINSTEYAGYYKRYIDTVTKGVQLSDAYQKVGKLKKYMEKIPKVKLSYRYDEGKWSIKEVYQHIIDTERVFAYRLFRIGRMDSTSLSGFNQDDFIEPSAADSKSLELLHHEYCTTRANTSAIIHSLSAD
ncbi:MAG: DinB family protein, partial [Saprospiraceae bacterium]